MNARRTVYLNGRKYTVHRFAMWCGHVRTVILVGHGDDFTGWSWDR